MNSEDDIELAPIFETLSPILKYTGSKRVQVPEIQKRMPKQIKNYWEPFVGGANVVGNLILEADNVYCSDIINPLIQLYTMVQDEPYRVVDTYRIHWSQLQQNPKYFYEIRKEFNNTQDPALFFFLCRTSHNGLIRFNRKGWFNSALGHSSDGRTYGANPDNIADLLWQWQQRFLAHPVQFSCVDYALQFMDMQEGDFTYLDPPYPSKNAVYGAGWQEICLFNWLGVLNERGVKWMLSYPYPADPMLVKMSKRQDIIEAKTMNFGNLNRTGKLKEFKEIIYMNYEEECSTTAVNVAP